MNTLLVKVEHTLLLSIQPQKLPTKILYSMETNSTFVSFFDTPNIAQINHHLFFLFVRQVSVLLG